MNIRQCTVNFLLGLSITMVLAPRNGVADDMSPATKAKVSKAAVQIFTGDKKADSEEIGDKFGAWGSGSFINGSGLVITNNHVVDPAHRAPNPTAALQLRQQFSLLQYRVIVGGGTSQEKMYKATVVYQSESGDLAMLQTQDNEGQLLQTPEYLEVFPTANVTKGMKVWLFGFPGGPKMRISKDRMAPVTITEGNIIDVPTRPGGRIPGIITDVQAAGGNSGGPMVNAQGQIIGIVSTIAADDRAASKVNARLVPGYLVRDMVKIAFGLNKMSAGVDRRPFESSLADDRAAQPAGRRSLLYERLDMDNPDLIDIAKRLDDNDLPGAEKLLNPKLAGSSFKALPEPMQEQVQAMHAELQLRKGEYDSALSAFKKLRNAKVEHVRAYASGRSFLLNAGGDHMHDGQPLSKPDAFSSAAQLVAREFVDKARRMLQAGDKEMLDSHRDWKGVVRDLKELEENLWIANSLDPGGAENDIFRLWRLRQSINLEEIRRLMGTTKDLDRQIEDYNDSIKKISKPSEARQARDRREGLDQKMQRFDGQLKDVTRDWEDMFKNMDNNGPVGFRIDDSAALGIID